MSMTNLTDPSFTSEQKEYLQGFFAGVAQRRSAGTSLLNGGQRPALPAPAEEPQVHGTPLSDLCREELWKYEQNPLDLWERLLEHASENKAPAADDLFRFKFHGLFYVAPAQDSFMLRMRVPGGVMTTTQMRGLAELASTLGCGRADLTTRGNVQLREFQPKDIVRVLAKVQALGMSSRGAGADNIRNITASPLAGIDAKELLDVSPLAEALNLYIQNSRDLYDLPRKFNVAFDGGGAVSVVADTNDIGFVAVRVPEGRDVPAGVYFRVLLCGITGHRQFASDCGLLLRPDQAVAVAVAMIRVFSRNGDRTDRKKARLKYLIDRWGIDQFLHETEKLLSFPLIRFGAEDCEARGTVDRGAHLGVHPQLQQDKCYLGIAIPVGQLPVAKMLTVAEVAERFGSGEVRLTVWQNLIVPNVSRADAGQALEALAAAGLSTEAGTVMRGTVACTGSKGCKYAATDTKAHAVELARYLDERFRILQPVNLHVTGCHHSCAQHYIGDIGLMGVKVKGEEGYQVNLGGGSDQDQGIARELFPALSFRELPSAMEALFSAYGRLCKEDESFLTFTRRHSVDELRAFCSRSAEVN